jgi:hypothetical protein
MLNGTSTVIAGPWPLPALTTGRRLAAIVELVGNGIGLASAFWPASAAATTGPVVERCGLHHFGRPEGLG